MTRTLNEKITGHASVLDMLKNANMGFYPFPIPDEYTNWRVEQRAWQHSAVLFDQSYHMTDLHITGPDRLRLLSDISINDYSRLGSLSALQIVVCSDGGHIVGDAVLFHLRDGSLNVVGKPSCGNFIEYAAASGAHDVTLRKDARLVEGGGARECFRFQLQGPSAYPILEKVNGARLPELRLFGMCEFSIGGCRVTGLRHGMAAAPGMEFWGPYAERERVLCTLLEAGEEFELRCGGARAYSTAGPQSGWVGALLPAVYSGADMTAYRNWLDAESYEGTLSIGGSHDSEAIEEYYFDPWDLGYHRFIDWDRDFKGREALRARREAPRRRKIWLRWAPEDVLRIHRSMLNGEPPCKYLDMPAGHYATCPFDKVLIDGRQVGISVYAVYTTAVGGWFSIGIVNEADVAFGAEVEIVWGEPDGGTTKPTVEPHRQATIRATMARSALG